VKLLLDTHVFIWSVLEPEKLSSQIVMLISSDDNDLFLSTASIWEMQIKIGIGKLHFDNLLSEIVAQQREINELKILRIKLRHIWQLNNLPLHHKDPFDRMIISQAITENLPILTIDNIFNQYPINIIW
jgi:PIN domain nuclease of toxin-antitoxin system